MTSEEIRHDVLELVNRLRDRPPTVQTTFLLQQSLVCAVYECAAQIAELNEQLRDRVTPL